MTEVLTIRESDILARQATHLIGTLGHVSEGKSTLIRALTGVKTQRHAKEQERNITIHLGYASCKVWQDPTGGISTKESEGATLIAHLSWVDCPGHEAFLATMLGGASVMDTACLIIAANQETIPQPQTLEHLMAAELMGLTRISVLQNKLDLIDKKTAEFALGKIRAFTEGSIAEGAPVFPGSAQHGWGVDRVLEWVTGLAKPSRDLQAPARLTCVRSFDINRPGPFSSGSSPGSTKIKGAVIGGTLERGVLVVGDWIELRPGILRRDSGGVIKACPIRTRVRGIRCETTDLPLAVPGALIALATDLDPGLSSANGMVGQRVGVPGSLPPIVGQITIRLHKLKRDTFAFGKHKVGDRVRVCSSVMTTEGTITMVDDKKRVTIVLDRPLCLDVGEQVGLLRFHKEAGRELIEGAGDVRAVEVWPDVEALPDVEDSEVSKSESSEDTVRIPNRRIEWIPVDKSEWSCVPRTYNDMLADVMATKEEVLGSSNRHRFRLLDPEINRIPKHTVWMNWPQTMDSLDIGKIGSIRYFDHFKEWIEAELQTPLSINVERQLDLRGFWKAVDLRSLLRKYVSIYKRCGQCQGFDTGLVKDRVLKVRCTRCLTDSAVNA